jgi:hypothetical protein
MTTQTSAPTEQQFVYVEFDIIDEMDQIKEVSVFIIGQTSPGRPLAKVARNFATGMHPGYTIRIISEGTVYASDLRSALKPLPK